VSKPYEPIADDVWRFCPDDAKWIAEVKTDHLDLRATITARIHEGGCAYCLRLYDARAHRTLHDAEGAATLARAKEDFARYVAACIDK
jgi:hypothetical protein